MLAGVSYKFLLVSFVCNCIWLSYSLRINNMDLIVINGLATIISAFFLSLYMYVKIKIGHHQRSFLLLLLSIPVISVCYSSYLSTQQTGILATASSVCMYAASLDSISMTLKTRDSKTVNMGIVVASVINGFIWMLYAILVSDIYVLTPNLAALASAFLQLNLYKWTKG